MRLDDNAQAQRSLEALAECGLLTKSEISAARGFAADELLEECVARAESVHVHVKVDDTDKIPVDALLAAGAQLERSRPGYGKYRLPGGINAIFSHVQVSADDISETTANRRPRPFLDHIGIDMREANDETRHAFEALPAIAKKRGWAHVAQGGQGRAVSCCHAEVAEKHWLFPANAGIPLEFAFGPLKETPGSYGGDLRPADPRKAVASAPACCAVEPQRIVIAFGSDSR